MKSLIIVFICVFVVSWSFASEMAADFIHVPIELEEDEHIVKRQAPAKKDDEKPAAKKDDTIYTSVKTKAGCKLYAKEVIFFKKTAKASGEQGQYDTAEISFPGTSVGDMHEGTCGDKNLTGTIVLDYKTGGPFKPDKGEGVLDRFILSFNISYLRPYGWWEVTSMDVDASGSFINDKDKKFSERFNGTVLRTMAIGASKKFCYACGQPPTMYYSMDEKKTTVYGLKFRNLQIQPFVWHRSPGNFTDNVDDCVPFFSIGIWMFLVVAAILLLVVFFGIGMIGSLKTMDRFDDPKGKPLVISAKD